MADARNAAPDYSNSATLGDKKKRARPRIDRAVALTVPLQDVRCAKGDCNQDYAPG